MRLQYIPKHKDMYNIKLVPMMLYFNTIPLLIKLKIILKVFEEIYFNKLIIKLLSFLTFLNVVLKSKITPYFHLSKVLFYQNIMYQMHLKMYDSLLLILILLNFILHFQYNFILKIMINVELIYLHHH